MTPKEELSTRLDDLINAYHAMGTGPEELHNMLAVRRDIAVTCYSLSSYTKEMHGKAGLTHLQRKFLVAKTILKFRSDEIKAASKPSPMNVMELIAQDDKDVVLAQNEEIMADAEREALKTKLQFASQVLASLNQEIAVLSQEAKTAHFQAQAS